MTKIIPGGKYGSTREQAAREEIEPPKEFFVADKSWAPGKTDRLLSRINLLQDTSPKEIMDLFKPVGMCRIDSLGNVAYVGMYDFRGHSPRFNVGGYGFGQVDVANAFWRVFTESKSAKVVEDIAKDPDIMVNPDYRDVITLALSARKPEQVILDSVNLLERKVGKLLAVAQDGKIASNLPELAAEKVSSNILMRFVDRTGGRLGLPQDTMERIRDASRKIEGIIPTERKKGFDNLVADLTRVSHELYP